MQRPGRSFEVAGIGGAASRTIGHRGKDWAVRSPGNPDARRPRRLPGASTAARVRPQRRWPRPNDMSDALREFIEARVPTEGLAAWGAQRADRSCVSKCHKKWLTSGQVEQTVSRLVVAAQNLARHDIEPLRLCWTFQHARVHLALRADG